MSKKYRRIRIPAVGTALVVLVETRDGWLIKAPSLSNRDHLTLLREDGGVGKHLTDEQDDTPSRHARVGKITRDTPRPEMRFFEDHAVELADGDELYAIDLTALFAGQGPKASSIPSADLHVEQSSIDLFRAVDLAGFSAFRRTTVGEAKRTGLRGGFRRVGSENVAVLQLAGGQLIQLTLSEFFGEGAETARVVGVGDLLGRAKKRRLAEDVSAVHTSSS
jgi:hypothetical protein